MQLWQVIVKMDMSLIDKKVQSLQTTQVEQCAIADYITYLLIEWIAHNSEN